MLRTRLVVARDAARAIVALALAACAASCGRGDADLETAVKRQLAKDRDLAALDISVDVRSGVAHLSGETRSVADQERAVGIARSLEGVKNVVNEMTISDAPIVKAVRAALAAEPALASVPIDVDSKDGHVRLMSESTTPEQRERTVAIARTVAGVRAVEDRMR